MPVIADGYTDVPPGKVAAVVTYLEMRAPAQPRPAPALTDVAVRAVTSPNVDWYRDIYSRVGTVDWLWHSRLALSPVSLETIIQDPAVEIHALVADGRDEGLLELDFRVPGECELTFFGLTRALVGRGAGRLLMNHALDRAWSQPIQRFWLHTCTWDHPGAVAFYVRTGFRPYQQKIEVADDPRLTGVLPATVAPQFPIIRGQ